MMSLTNAIDRAEEAFTGTASQHLNDLPQPVADTVANAMLEPTVDDQSIAIGGAEEAFLGTGSHVTDPI